MTGIGSHTILQQIKDSLPFYSRSIVPIHFTPDMRFTSILQQICGCYPFNNKSMVHIHFTTDIRFSSILQQIYGFHPFITDLGLRNLKGRAIAGIRRKAA